MLLTGSSGSWTTLWVGGDFDPTADGIQTAAAYVSGSETFTLAVATDVYAGIFTKNQGSAIPLTNTSVGKTDHDSSFTAPTGPGDTVDGISHPNLQRVHAFEVNVVSGGGTGGNNFSDWIAGFSVGGQTGIGDDPDGDGNDNGVENFFGTAPDAFSQGLVASTADTGAGTFTFTHPQGTLADDLTATYQWSVDLDNFFADGVADGGVQVDFVATPDTPSAGTTTVVATVTTGPVPEKLFVDVEVTQP
jgi:hypothetical protein